jgi:hypothetical protein
VIMRDSRLERIAMKQQIKALVARQMSLLMKMTGKEFYMNFDFSKPH